MSSVTDQLGRVLAGRYRLVAPIGTGASAHVYAADDTILSRRVAVKVLHPALAGDQGFLRRFRAEAQAAASLNHPHVMRVFDWGEDRDGPFLVLEYLGGGSLRDLLDAGHLLTVSQAAALGAQAAHGLAYAHRRGFVHRDIKPANILFDDEGSLRVGDFGLARALAEAAWTEPIGAVLGTARYASPEQAEGKVVNEKTDVYSLALVLFESITGWVPFTADTTVATLMARLNAHLPVLPSLGLLGPVLAQAAIPQPLARLDAAALAIDLELACRELPPPAPVPVVGIGGAPAGDRDPTMVGDSDRARRSNGASHSANLDGAAALAAAATAATSAALAPSGIPAGGRPAGTPSGDQPTQAVDPRQLAASLSAISAPTAPFRPALSPEPVQPGRHGGRAKPPRRPKPARQAKAPAQPALPRQPKRRRRRVAALVAVSLVVVLVCLALVGSALGVISYRSSLAKGHAVPEVKGFTTVLAQKLASQEDLQIVVVGHSYSPLPAGEIVNQTPRPGSVEAGGSMIKVTLSEGVAPVAIPSLLGDTAGEARQALAHDGLKYAAAPAQYNENVKAGNVIGWSPDGIEVKPGTTVKVTLSMGPHPRLIPTDLAGKSFGNAASVLAGEQLVPVETQKYSNSWPKGEVMATYPPLGQTTPRGSTVTVVVSLGPQYVTIPYDIQGMPVSQAERLLRSIGLVPEGPYPPTGGTVFITDPVPGTSVKVGTPVAIYTSFLFG